MKVIGDPIHGYIQLSDVEYGIIQLPALVRLHRVKQSATAYLTFPGALTSRFEHVVGALHIGSRIFSQLFDPILQDENLLSDLFPLVKKSETSILTKAVRLACLMHDLGHGPFSHSAEELMEKVVSSNELKNARKLFKVDEGKSPPIHEYYSYQLIRTGAIREVLSCEDTQLADWVSGLLTKTEDTKLVRENLNGFRLLRKIVSSQLDADRMDYLLRDGLMSGVKFGQVDIWRVILNMSIIKKGKNFYSAIHNRALGSIEDMLDARFKMYKWFYNHHSVIATNLLIENAMEYMINDGFDKKIFHWSSFDQGLSTDDYIMSELTKRIQSNKKDYPYFRGLVDRRYIPVSILKRPADCIALVNEVNEFSTKKENTTAVIGKIAKFFTDKKIQKELESKLEKKGKPFSDIRLLADHYPRTPYSHIKPDDQIWLRGKNDRLVEFTEESAYFAQINKEWADFPSIYVSYVIKDMTKQKAERYRDKIYEVIKTEIASV